MTDKYLAVFDWNCTLIDDFAANLAGMNAVLKLFDRAPITAEKYREVFTFPILHSYVTLGIGADEFLSRHEEAAQVFFETCSRESLKVGLKPGALELLQWLNERNVHCMLLSNHLDEVIRIDLKRLQITDFFDHISGVMQYDASFISKTNKQDRLSAHMTEHGFDPARAFIIGDSHEEPEIGHNIGLKTFSITGGLLNNERLEACNPDYIVDDLHAVQSILENIWTV